MADIKDRHSDLDITVLRNFNVHLDSSTTVHTYLQSIMFDFNLTDAYRHAHPDPATHPGFTRRNWTGQKTSASRIDGIFICQANIDKLKVKPELIATVSDHSVLKINITKENIPFQPKSKAPCV